jgi:hypothetical protein
MIIISKFKDYYDHLQGIYGRDEKAIYERKPLMFKNNKWIDVSLNMVDTWLCKDDDITYETIAICGKLYYYFKYKNKIYHNYEIIEAVDITFKKYRDLYLLFYDSKYSYVKGKIHIKKYIKELKLDTNINDVENCPVFLVNSKIKNPRLKDFEISKLLEPKDIYIQINSFLLKEKEIKDNRTNNEIITSNGFDLKTSFRKL